MYIIIIVIIILNFDIYAVVADILNDQWRHCIHTQSVHFFFFEVLYIQLCVLISLCSYLQTSIFSAVHTTSAPKTKALYQASKQTNTTQEINFFFCNFSFSPFFVFILCQLTFFIIIIFINVSCFSLLTSFHFFKH